MTIFQCHQHGVFGVIASSQSHCGAVSTQAEVSKAEAAGSAASGALSGLSLGSDMLTPLIQRARKQVEIEGARGGLHKAIAGARTHADLPHLEAAIQAARRLGVHDRLQEASRYRQHLAWIMLSLLLLWKCSCAYAAHSCLAKCLHHGLRLLQAQSVCRSSKGSVWGARVVCRNLVPLTASLERTTAYAET